MRWKHTLLIGAALAALATFAVAQTVVQDNLSGNETWQAGQGPGGPGQFITSNELRNGNANLVVTTLTSFTFGASTASALNFGGNLLLTLQPAAITTLTAMPNPVPDGATISWCNVTGSAFATTAINFAANTGQTLNTTYSVNNLGANTCSSFQFNRAATTWYRIH